MLHRDAAEYSEASYTADPAEGCDSLEDHIRELVAEYCGGRVDGATERRLGRVVTTVTRRLLDEGRLGAAVEVRRIEGRELMGLVVAEIMEAPNPRLMARCMDFVLELGVQLGISETEMAKREGVTKATASRYCVHIKDLFLGGKPAAGMKSQKAVQSYKENRTGKSSRGPRHEWAFGEAFKKAYGERVSA